MIEQLARVMSAEKFNAAEHKRCPRIRCSLDEGGRKRRFGKSA